jgi:hypothetical protein
MYLRLVIGRAMFALCLLGACTADGDVVALGHIEVAGATIQIETPPTITANETFMLRVVTYGDTCVDFERTDVDHRTDGADIRPYDRDSRGDGVCGQKLCYIPHDVELMFSEPGDKTLDVHGRNQNDDVITVPVVIHVN